MANFKAAAKPAGYRVIARSKDRGEIYIYGGIGQSMWGEGVSAKMFADDLKKLGAVTTIDVRINSEGGDVFDGKAIYTLLNEHPARIVVHIDGLAASAASFIAMAGDEIQISEGAFVMIHEAAGGCFGRAKDMVAYADLLEAANASIVDTYVARTKNDADTIKKWMADETWMNGKEAKERGFADKVVANSGAKAQATVTRPTMYNNLPATLRPNRAKALAAMAA